LIVKLVVAKRFVRQKERTMKSKTTGWIIAACVALAPVLCVEPMYGDTVHASADTNINLATPGQVNGNSTSIFIRNSGSGGERHAFLRFDLSTLPPGISVSKATPAQETSSVVPPLSS
jgi:hypothetical protein